MSFPDICRACLSGRRTGEQVAAKDRLRRKMNLIHHVQEQAPTLGAPILYMAAILVKPIRSMGVSVTVYFSSVFAREMELVNCHRNYAGGACS
jgi:hypothetical protein